jgi:hypothetical protein
MSQYQESSVGAVRQVYLGLVLRTRAVPDGFLPAALAFFGFGGASRVVLAL